MSTVSITLNGKQIEVEAGETVLSVARKNGMDIPTLCEHPDAETSGHCGMCVVEVAGEEALRYACECVVKDGMEIVTESERIAETRTRNLEKVFAKHTLKCGDCLFMGRCRLLELSRKFSVKPVVRKKEGDRVISEGVIVFDQEKCIECGHCVSVCPVGFLEIDDRGRVSTVPEKNCINCGQCIVHCPVGAIEGDGEFEELAELEAMIAEGKKTVVVQFAPSIRTAIGEEFGMEAGSIATGQLVAGLRKAGFAQVFDTASGADFTTMEEANELVERVTSGKNLPAMTSCCPSWVLFVEKYYPEFVPNLCTSRSPQVMLGGIIKEYWAKGAGIDPNDVYVVSIMPCVSKKFEARREELKIDGRLPVDKVLTTRELARLLKKHGVDLKTIESEDADNPFGDPSGAGVIYGSSGGVFESALRTAYFKMTGQNIPTDAVKDIRGDKGIKKKEITIADKTIKLCVASGIQNARKILEELKADPKKYDAVEIMACPGGCVGGGGQPVPMTKETVRARAKGLYFIDDAKTLRYAHEGKDVQKVYQEFFTTEEVRKKVLHTKFFGKNFGIME